MSFFVNQRALLAKKNHQVASTFKISGQTQAIASYAQQRLWLHEQFSFRDSDLAMYNLIIPIIIKRGSLSIEHIRSALLSVLKQNTILRTAIRFNEESGQIDQYIQPLSEQSYSFEHTNGVFTPEQLDHLLTAESITKHFNLDKGIVVRCHVVQRSDDTGGGLLKQNDTIVFAFHHIVFDNSSVTPFIEDFVKAYQHRESFFY
ncbi:unnamed protein product [Rotaria socialis]|uniref:Condensation domain-containing protein n=1 Tax=Rotaria socialis TaxID=392032 RepID=A0A818FEE6_9BILA|nr:unnamed protein product [Rotaria socialis]CAF4582247.1 unnamed protein product [Rotaria socialis]